MKTNSIVSRVVIVAVVGGASSYAWGGDELFAPISIASFANTGNPLRNFPLAPTHLGGVLFDLPADAYHNMWTSNQGTNGTFSLSVPMHVFGAKTVYTLINTSWGAQGPPSRAYLAFKGSRGATHRLDLVGGVHIRDWNQYIYTNGITSPDTVMNVVYEYPNVYGTEGRQDMQRITLPAEFHNQTLVEVALVDSGAYEVQRTYICGITAEALTSAVSITGNVDLQDYFGGSLPAVAMKLRQGGFEEDLGVVSLAADGAFSVATRCRGAFEILVKGSHWLQATGGIVNLGDSGAAGVSVSLRNGDVDGDNAVTVFDYSLLSDAFDSVPGDGNWIANADLDGDDAVTVFDYAILSASFDMVGD